MNDPIRLKIGRDDCAGMVFLSGSGTLIDYSRTRIE